MSWMRDRQARRFAAFLIGAVLLLIVSDAAVTLRQQGLARGLLLERDAAVATALLGQGMSEADAARILAGTETGAAGLALLEKLGRTAQTDPRLLREAAQIGRTTGWMFGVRDLLLCIVLFAGALMFFERRERLYRTADAVVGRFMEGDFSGRLPRMQEGTLDQLFASVDQLATALQAQNEAERQTKQFLKDTISDISHQLKTPLAALTMYQEIILSAADEPETVTSFAKKSDAALDRIASLIGALLKFARLDAGSIVFARQRCPVSELAAQAVRELTTRAAEEGKLIVMDGPPEDSICCDPQWTAEALGNLVKNALDHTAAGGRIAVRWARTPTMLRITVSDNGCGIPLEELHHIFKRFYRSRNALDTPGIGIGLPLARAIIEGQGGSISVQSTPGVGTDFILSFLTEL